LGDLAERASRGETAAAQALCQAIKDPILAYCIKRLGNRADADDICQEVLVAVIAGLPRLQRFEGVIGYAIGIARNQVNRHFNRGPARREVPIDDELRVRVAPGPMPGEEDPEDLAVRREAALKTVLADEPEDVRQLMYLFYQEKRTSAEIGEALGMQASGVRMKAKRIRERLRRRLLRIMMDAER